MAVFSGPEIVNNGLLAHLDASSPKSIKNTQAPTQWDDVSGNSKHASLISNPVYTTERGGALTFDGTAARALLPANLFNYTVVTTFTMSIWVSSTQTTGGPLFVQQQTTTPDTASGWVPVIYLNTNGTIRAEPFWTGGTSNFISSSTPINDGKWHNVVTTYSNGTNDLYIDGSYITQRTGLTQTGYAPTYYYFLGAGYSQGRSLGTNYFSGKIAQFSFYTRALPLSEIKQNFEATRGRFGI